MQEIIQHNQQYASWKPPAPESTKRRELTPRQKMALFLVSMALLASLPLSPVYAQEPDGTQTPEEENDCYLVESAESDTITLRVVYNQDSFNQYDDYIDHLFGQLTLRQSGQFTIESGTQTKWENLGEGEIEVESANFLNMAVENSTGILRFSEGYPVRIYHEDKTCNALDLVDHDLSDPEAYPIQIDFKFFETSATSCRLANESDDPDKIFTIVEWQGMVLAPEKEGYIILPPGTYTVAHGASQPLYPSPGVIATTPPDANTMSVIEVNRPFGVVGYTGSISHVTVGNVTDPFTEGYGYTGTEVDEAFLCQTSIWLNEQWQQHHLEGSPRNFATEVQFIME